MYAKQPTPHKKFVRSRHNPTERLNSQELIHVIHKCVPNSHIFRRCHPAYLSGGPSPRGHNMNRAASSMAAPPTTFIEDQNEMSVINVCKTVCSKLVLVANEW